MTPLIRRARFPLSEFGEGVRGWGLTLFLLIAACAPAGPLPPTVPPPTRSGSYQPYELFYLFRDESVESTQAFQIGSVITSLSPQAPVSRVVQRFPIDGIAIPWDTRPPTALSPDGSTLAMVQWDEQIGAVLLLDVKTNAAKAISGLVVSGLYTPTILGWSPDGVTLYLYDESQTPGKVLSYTLANNALRTVLTIPDAAPQTGLELLSPDASRLAYCAEVGNRGCIRFAIRELVGSAPPVLTSFIKGTVCPGYPAYKWSPDSRTVAIGCLFNLRKASLELIDGGTGQNRSIALPFELNDLAWSADNQRLLIDLCAGNYVNVADPDCGALQFLNVAAGTLMPGPAIERTEARRLYWLGDQIIFNQSTGGGQEATMYFYDIPTRQSKQFTRNASTYADASFTVMALRAVR